MMHSLPIFLKLAERNVILIGDGEAACAKRALLERAGAICVDEGADSQIAIVAIEDDASALSAIARLKARAILVNAVDRPAECDFTLPAIVDRSPVLIAIGTGGASAGLAKALRIRLEALIPQSLGNLANQLAKARTAIRVRWPKSRDRRVAIDAALDPGGPLDPFQDREDEAVDQWLVSSSSKAIHTLVTLTITSDDPDDLTLRQARLLGKADQVFHQPDISCEILNRARADAVRQACTSPPDVAVNGLTLFLTRG